MHRTRRQLGHTGILPGPALRSGIAAVLIALGFAIAGCQPLDTGAPPTYGGVSAQRASAYADRISHLPASELSDADVIALGYLERARVGLGSPFRLIEYALNDPLLAFEERSLVGNALLARVQEGEIYQQEPQILEVIRLAGVNHRVPSGQRQLELIARIIEVAPTAESGERSVRLGYEIAAAERTVTTNFPSVIAHVAALAADRRRAQEDADRLVAAARAEGVSPLTLIPRWRAERRFNVEGPAMRTLTASEEEVIATQAPRVALAIRALSQRLASANANNARLAGTRGGPQPLLSHEAAERLVAVTDARGYPPQAPISVALMINRDGYLDASNITEQQLQARQEFLASSFNEESFVAGLVLQDSLAAGEGIRLRLTQLQAAVFFRVWNQEVPWFPGDPAPETRDLIGRFGLEDVVFGSDVPAEWRPYHRRTLAHGLTDLERVLPTASLRGLTIRFDALPGERRALALHDPGSRTLYLPPRTGAGTLAHEIAHDLDWQLARRRYGTRRGYATDLAVSSGRQDRIAYALTGLAASLTQPDSERTPHDTRPAEVFARGTDWLVGALLAREGRTGGYLTSFQDPALTGYGTTRGPDIGGGAVGSLLDILQGVAPLPPAAAEWAMATHGPQRRLTPSELAREVAGAGSDQPPLQRFSTISEVRDRSLSSLESAGCRLTSAEGLRRLGAAQRDLIDVVASAAARGAAIDAAREVAREASLAPELAEAWMANRLYGAPTPADTTILPLQPTLEDIVYRVHALERERAVQLVNAFDFTPPPTLCGGNPFASGILRSRPR